MTTHQVVAREQWMAARRALLAEEKAWTRERDRLAAKVRGLPWVRVDKEYRGASHAGRAVRWTEPAHRLSLYVWS
jgi:predicted dithiol-disulfide oxidoreductase (DUF899 family)